MIATHQTTETLTARLGKPEEHRVRRDGKKDLVFQGWEIGMGSDGTGGEYGQDWTRWTNILIYATVGGRLITSVNHESRWIGERTQYSAATHVSADDAYR